jgi:histone H3/H4
MAIIVKSQIKDIAKMNIAADFAPALEEKVKQLIEKAAQRAELNNRRTLMAKDL